MTAGSARPFDHAPAYRAGGWLGTLPLPAGAIAEFIADRQDGA